MLVLSKATKVVTSNTTALTQSEETYVETIYSLIREHGYARVADVATELGVKPPSVTNMLQKLDEQKFVNYTKYRGVVLTRKGRLLAETLERRHHALKEFLIMIGVSEESADKDSCEIEHSIDGKTAERLASFVEFVQSAPQYPHFLENFKEYCRAGKHPGQPKLKGK